MTIIYNKYGKNVLMYFTANATMNVAVVNSTVDSDLKVTGEEQKIRGATITKLAWSTNAANPIIVKRGANVVFNLTRSDHWDLRAMNMVQDLDRAATLDITMPDTNSTLYIELTKLHAGGTPNRDDH